mmetsp:Transcript_23573/g.44848  ORF Transcript_23573/g.44848 Transcript_23573/m.44848 type:complete len:91 (-) Transcript_23573:2325-2597(-)
MPPLVIPRTIMHSGSLSSVTFFLYSYQNFVSSKQFKVAKHRHISEIRRAIGWEIQADGTRYPDTGMTAKCQQVWEEISQKKKKPPRTSSP